MMKKITRTRIARLVQEKLHLVFTVSVSVAVVTALTTLTMCYRFKHLSNGVYFPKISATGSPYPEHYVYALGFTISSFTLAAGMWAFHMRLMPQLFLDGEWERLMNGWAFRTGLLSCAGIFVQSLFGGRPEHMFSFVVHTVGSSTFFFSGGLYMVLVVIILRKSARIPLSGGFTPQSRKAKRTLATVYWSFGVVFAICYAFFKRYVVGYFFTALSEWVTALSYQLFIATYIPDVKKIRVYLQRPVSIAPDEEYPEMIAIDDSNY